MIKKPQKGDRWSREEMIVVFNLYLRLPYGQMDHRNKEVQALAKLMGRTENSVAMRLNNFAACDPMLKARGIKELGAQQKQCQPYWDEFFSNQEKLVFESERILAEYEKLQLEEKFKDVIIDMPKDLRGENKRREVQCRVNQNFFRKVILCNYDGKCALSGIDIKELLVASHIIPWAVGQEERLNPENGICLSSLYDKSFDCGLISFNDDRTILFSSELERNCDKDYYERYFLPIKGHQLSQAVKYQPNPYFLQWHREHIFRGI